MHGYLQRARVRHPTSRILGGRSLLVPGQWTGSVEHYYHFLLAYLFPLVLLIREAGLRAVTVRQCGPLDAWLRLLAHSCDVEVVPPGIMLERLVREAQGAIILEPLDDPARFDADQLRAFREAFPIVTGVPIPVAEVRTALVLDRGAPHPFYMRPGAEGFGTASGVGSGSLRRSLPDVGLIAEGVAAHLPTRVIDSANIAPAAQVDAFARAQVLVGQHGAGLANMIWMRPPALVVEILPRDAPGIVRGIFRDLARALSLDYVVVSQDDSHGDVDPHAVAAAVAAFTGSG